MTDLELVSTDDLIHELKRRVHYMVVGLRRDLAPNKFEFSTYFQGDSHVCAGLASHIAKEILERLDKGE